MHNLHDLELRVRERLPDLMEEIRCDALSRRTRGSRQATSTPVRVRPLRVRFGILLIRLGARLAARPEVVPWTGAPTRAASEQAGPGARE